MKELVTPKPKRSESGSNKVPDANKTAAKATKKAKEKAQRTLEADIRDAMDLVNNIHDDDSDVDGIDSSQNIPPLPNNPHVYITKTIWPNHIIIHSLSHIPCYHKLHKIHIKTYISITHTLLINSIILFSLSLL